MIRSRRALSGGIAALVVVGILITITVALAVMIEYRFVSGPSLPGFP